MYSLRTILILALFVGLSAVSSSVTESSVTESSASRDPGRPVLLAFTVTQSASLAPVVTVDGATPQQRDRVVTALRRFREEGLMLPDIRVVFATQDLDACRGNLGLFSRNVIPLNLTVCSDLEFIVIHEFAHAWIHVHLDDRDQEKYTALRGLETWNGSDAEWKDRGVEDAAFVIQQSLMGVGTAMTTRLVLDRIDAYEGLTGRLSPLRAGLSSGS